MKSKSLKYFAVIALMTLFIIMTLSFIKADKKEETKKAVFIKRFISKENI